MIIIKLFIAILAGVLIGSVITIVYVKFLSVMSKRYGESIRRVLISHLFKKVSNPRTDSRENSSIEVGCIYCFDKAYNFLNANVVRRIGWGIKNIIWHKPISDNCNGKNDCRTPKCDDENPKSFCTRGHVDKSTIGETHESTKRELNHTR